MVALGAIATEGPPPAAAQTAAPSATERPTHWIGRYSKKALPRYASLKADRVFFRLGPGKEYAIRWVLERQHMPVRIIGEYGNWRRVELVDGERGWIHRALLSGARHVLAAEDWTPIYARPEADAERVVAAPSLRPLRLLGCALDWCEVGVEGYRGWTPKRALWGVDPEDVF